MARRKKLQVEEKKERRLPTTRYNPEYKKGLTSQQVQEHRVPELKSEYVAMEL